MKKHLIAAAVAAAVVAPAAMAQSSVELYGILSTGYSSITSEGVIGNANVSRKITTTGAEGGQSGSRLGVRGKEDLGGGLSAGFVLEMAADMDAGLTNGADSTRLGYVDLTGAFGTIRGGRVDGVARQVQNNFTATGNSGFAPGNVAGSYAYAFSATGSVTGADLDVLKDMAWGQGGNGSNGRVSSSIGYISPRMNGFSAQVQYGKVSSDLSVTNGEATTLDALNFGISYAAGPLSILLGQDSNKTTTEAATPVELKYTTNTLGASYDFGVAKAFLAYTDRDREVGPTKTTVKDTTVGVSIPVAQKIVLVGSYSDGSLKGELVDNDSVDVSAYQLQANYLFSKRTKAYVMYGETEWKGIDGKFTIDGFILGVQHSF